MGNTCELETSGCKAQAQPVGCAASPNFDPQNSEELREPAGTGLARGVLGT